MYPKDTADDKFLAWLTKQIEIATVWENAVKPHEISVESDRFRIRAKTLEQVKEKYVELTVSTSNESL